MTVHMRLPLLTCRATGEHQNLDGMIREQALDEFGIQTMDELQGLDNGGTRNLIQRVHELSHP